MDILEILGKIGFDWRVFLLNLVNFVILMLILRKLLFGPVVKIMEERRRVVDENNALNEELKARELAIETERESVVNSAKDEASEIIKKAAERGKEIEHEAVDEANQKAQKIIDETKSVITVERQTMLKEFKKEATGIIVSVSNKVLEDAGSEYKVTTDKIDNLLDKS